MVNQEALKVPSVELPPDRIFLEIGRLGLPLGPKDNIVCGLAIVLAVAMHLRLQNTWLGEGWFVLVGFIGYVALRLWFLNRRYPDAGDLLVESTGITFPASVNFGQIETVEFTKLDRIQARVFKSRSGENLASIEFFCGLKKFKVNWLAVDLNKLERFLLQHNQRVTRIYGNYTTVFLVVIVSSALLLMLYLFLIH